MWIVLGERFRARIHEQDDVMNVTSGPRRFIRMMRSGFVVFSVDGEASRYP